MGLYGSPYDYVIHTALIATLCISLIGTTTVSPTLVVKTEMCIRYVRIPYIHSAVFVHNLPLAIVLQATVGGREDLGIRLLLCEMYASETLMHHATPSHLLPNALHFPSY